MVYLIAQKDLNNGFVVLFSQFFEFRLFHQDGIPRFSPWTIGRS